MQRRLKIGIVGCGAIGGSLAKAILKDFKAQARLSCLYDVELKKSFSLVKGLCKNRGLVAQSLADLIKESDLVIEAAAGKDSWHIAQQALRKGRSVMIMSVGGVTNRLKELSILANRYRGKVYIPSGAISGIDALKALAATKIRRVILTTRKHPVSFQGVKFITDKGFKLDKIKNDRLLFSGSARQAVKYFPQNINVAAILSLAGIGQDKTIVRIIASPFTKRNIHEIEIESLAASVKTRTENILHPQNPKTSYLAVLSAIATLRQILEPVRIGT